MFRQYVQPDVVIVHSVIGFEKLQLPEWWKSILQYSINLKKRLKSLNIQERDFNLLVLNKYFIWSFSAS